MSCSQTQQPAKDTPVSIPTVKVNSVVITEATISLEAQNHPAASLEHAIQKAKEALVIREVLLQRAKSLAAGASLTDDSSETEEEAAISELLKVEIVTPKADDETCKQYFATNQDKFHSPNLVEATHILLAAAPDDYETRDIQKKLAEELIDVLKKSPNKFPDLAQQYSACPSKDVAGSLGQLMKGSTVPEFEKRLFSLPEGLCEEPIATRYGYHIVRIDHRVECEPLPYEAVRIKIENYLNHQVYTRAVSQYIKILVGEADIEGVDMGVESSPLVQ